MAVDPTSGVVYTDEWEMPHDRINVFNPSDFSLMGFIGLHYPASLGSGFHLDRLQGAKVLGHTIYATRDDADKTVWSIDLRTGDVTRLFALGADWPTELEGLAVRPTADGAVLHVLVSLDGDIDTSGDIAHYRVELRHLAPPAGCTP